MAPMSWSKKAYRRTNTPSPTSRHGSTARTLPAPGAAPPLEQVFDSTGAACYLRPDDQEERMDDITARQRRILEFIRQTVQGRGYPPTVREIGEAVGLTSSSSVHAQLANLERRGLLRRDPTKPRAMELQGPVGRRAAAAVSVPRLGRVPAGAPVLA